MAGIFNVMSALRKRKERDLETYAQFIDLVKELLIPSLEKRCLPYSVTMAYQISSASTLKPRLTLHSLAIKMKLI
jgi:hypothetical protein